jgi:uncharacterized integral membrane protein
MLFLIVVTIVALTVAVVSLQNGQPAPVSFLVWQFQAPVAVIILASTAAGLVIGGLIGLARAVRRWSHRPDGPRMRDGDGPPTADAARAAGDHRVRSRTLP